MPRTQIKTKQEIQRDLINAVVARTALTDVTDSSVLKHILTAVAAEISEVYYQFTNLAALFDFRSASGADLDERAREILGATIERMGARRAVGQLSFERAVATGSPVTVPAGTVVETEDGVAVETTEDGTIAAGGTTTIPAVDGRALEVGTAGNIGVDTARAFRTKPAGVDTVTNPAVFANGRDRETDDAFRARILRVVETLPRCTPEALAFVVIGVEDPAGSGSQIIFSHTFEDPNAPGTAIVYVDDGTGSIREVESIAGIAQATAESISVPVAGVQTLTDTGNFPATGVGRAALVGQTIVVTNTNDPLNAGAFLVTACPDANTIRYQNAGGVAQAAPGALYVVGEDVTQGLAGPPADTAVGGEEFLNLDNRPLVAGSQSVHLVRGNSIVALVPGTAAGGDYDLRFSNGQLFFAGTAGPLQNGDRIVAAYTHYVGAIQEAQKVIDGDPNDRLNYPGWRAAGVDVRVLEPNLVQQVVIARIVVLEGFQRTTAVAQVRTAISDYINNLGISGDVIRHELVERIMQVPGVYDVDLVAPTGNRTIDDDELARIDSTGIDVA